MGGEKGDIKAGSRVQHLKYQTIEIENPSRKLANINARYIDA